MFFGESTHSLDAKHRVFVPKRFQEALERDESGSLTVVLTRGFERCLFFFSDAHFQAVLKRLELQPFSGEQTRRMQRLFFANTHRATLDGSGRLVLPEKMRRFAGIEKEVVLVGVADRAEVWDKESWESYEAENEGRFDELGTVLLGAGDPIGGS